MNYKPGVLATITLPALILLGCTTAPPTIQTGADAELSYDGMSRIDNSIFKKAWADPDIDFSTYNKIMPGGAFFEYRAVKKVPANMQRSSGRPNDEWMSDDDKQRLEQEVTAVFQEEVSKSTRFTVVSEPGPDVLIIRGGLLDVVSRVPKDRPDFVGRGEVYLRSFGEATLVLEVVDSMSGETIYRAVERGSAERPGGTAALATDVTTWEEVRRLARRWATTLRDGLDSIPSQ